MPATNSFGKKSATQPLSPARTMRDVLPIEGRWLVLRASLWTLIAFYVVSLGMEVWRLWVLHLLGDKTSMFAMMDGVDSVLGWAAYIVLFGSFVAYARFTHRAMHNVHAVSRMPNLMSPSGTWACFFVPIAFFWMPFKGAAQMWRHGRTSGPSDAKLPESARLWWIFHLGEILIRGVWNALASALATSEGGWTLENAITYTQVLLLTAAMGLLSVCALYRFFGEIAKDQRKLSDPTVEDVFG